MTRAFRELLTDGPAAWRNPWDRRLDGLHQIPDLVATRLAEGASRAEAAEWAARLERHFVELISERGGSWTRGWDHVGGGLLAAIGLLCPALPSSGRDALAASADLSRAHRAASGSFERFVPVLRERVQLVRALAGTSGPAALVDGHGSRVRARGRSHELMETLLREGDLGVELGLVVATGAVRSDGILEGVDGLGAKRAAAREAGAALMLSCAPATRDREQLVAALNGGEPERYFSLRGAPDDASWIAAGSLVELRHKLARLTNPEGSVAEGWNGRALRRADILPLPVQTAAGSGPRVESCAGDALFDSLRSTFAGQLPGVLVEGGPGSGKSIWSAELVVRFDSAPLSLLGTAIRVDARALAADLLVEDRLSVLSRLTGASLELLGALETTKRLLVVVDGLDELHTDDLVRTARFLRDTPFIATSRPSERVRAALSTTVRLDLGGLEADGAVEILRRRGREDLAGKLFSRQLGGRRRGPERPELQALCYSPFQLTLLADVLTEQEDPRLMNSAELYGRAWTRLVDAAVHDRRLGRDQADLLRRRVDTLVGELALAALKSAEGKVTRPMLQVHLEEMGFAGREALDVERALEWGYLLAPGGDDWEFAHRTIAEWAVSSAILHRAGLKVERRRRAGQPTEGGDRAQVEMETIVESLGDQRLWSASGWQQVLRFLAGRVRSPAALVRFVLEGLPRELEETELLAEWSFATELAGEATWPEEEARWAWGLLAREQVLPRPAVGLRAHDSPKPWFPERPRLLLRLTAHLPPSAAELLDLVAINQEQRAWLADNVDTLLRVCGPEQAWLGGQLLVDADAARQVDILSWFRQWRQQLEDDDQRRWRCSPPSDWAESAARRLARARPERGEDKAALRLETALYEGGSIPFKVRRARMRDWPQHLAPQLTQWFVRREGPTGGSDQHVEGLQTIASALVDAQSKLREYIADLCSSDDGLAAVGAAQRTLDHREERTARSLLALQVAQCGQADADTWQLSSEADDAARRAGMELARLVRDVVRRRSGVDSVVSRLMTSAAGSEEVARAWSVLPPSPERRVLMEALVDTRKLPEAIPVSALVDAFPDDLNWLDRRWTSETAWSPPQEQSWRVLAAESRGRTRAIARMWVAGRDETDLVSLLVEDVDESDSEYIGFARRALDSRYEEPQCDLPAWAPLKLRAARDTEGWREELLSELGETNEPDRVAELAKLASTHGLSDAAPLLVERAGRIEERWTREAVVSAALSLGASRASLEGVVPPAPDRKVPEGLVERASLEDLPDLLAIPSLGFGMERTLPNAIERLGPAAHEQVLEALRQRRAELRELEAAAETSLDGGTEAWEAATARRNQVYSLGKWIEALRECAIRSFDASAGSLAGVVDLGFEVFGGDIIEIGASFGPLGSDFDDPEDLEYDSSLQNERAIRRYLRLVRSAAPGCEDGPLRRLLTHPSETIQLGTYEFLVERTAAHAVADLAVDALEGHLRHTQRGYSGRVGEWRLAMLGGSGAVDLPETRSRLLDGVRKHLTPAHRNVLAKMSESDVPTIRLLAARWTAEVIPSEPTELLRPLVGDSFAAVVREAVIAWTRLDEPGLVETLRAVDRERWSEATYAAALQALLSRRVETWFETRVEPRELDAPDVLSLVRRLFAEGVMSVRSGEDERNPLVSGCPSLLELAIARLVDRARIEPGVLSVWLDEAATPARPSLRRCLVAMGRSDLLPRLRGLLKSDERGDRHSAVECLIASGDTEHTDTTLDAFWEDWMWWRPERVFWMLERAPVEYVGIAVALLSRIAQDEFGLPCDEATPNRVFARLRELDASGLSRLVAAADRRRRNLSTVQFDLREEFVRRPDALEFLGQLPRPEHSLAADLWEELTGETARSHDRSVLEWFRGEVLGSGSVVPTGADGGPIRSAASS